MSNLQSDLQSNPQTDLQNNRQSNIQSELHFVARTADGLSHRNTLVFRKLAAVVIYLDSWREQDALQDSFRLRSDEGLYERILQRTDATCRANRTLLRFTEVVPEGDYSLYHRLMPDVEYPVFLKIPFAVLEDHGDETPEPSRQSLAEITLTPEPDLVSGDLALLHDPADHALDVARYDQSKEFLPDTSDGSDTSDAPDTPDTTTA